MVLVLLAVIGLVVVSILKDKGIIQSQVWTTKMIFIF